MGYKKRIYLFSDQIPFDVEYLTKEVEGVELPCIKVSDPFLEDPFILFRPESIGSDNVLMENYWSEDEFCCHQLFEDKTWFDMNEQEATMLAKSFNVVLRDYNDDLSYLHTKDENI